MQRYLHFIFMTWLLSQFWQETAWRHYTWRQKWNVTLNVMRQRIVSPLQQQGQMCRNYLNATCVVVENQPTTSCYLVKRKVTSLKNVRSFWHVIISEIVTMNINYISKYFISAEIIAQLKKHDIGREVSFALELLSFGAQETFSIQPFQMLHPNRCLIFMFWTFSNVRTNIIFGHFCCVKMNK